MIERLVDWCARSDFFGDEEPGTVNYLSDTGEIASRERRFLGWFVFHFQRQAPEGTPVNTPA